MPLGIAAVEDLDVISMRWLLHPTPENTWRFHSHYVARRLRRLDRITRARAGDHVRDIWTTLALDYTNERTIDVGTQDD
jgi:hypothetical protein